MRPGANKQSQNHSQPTAKTSSKDITNSLQNQNTNESNSNITSSTTNTSSESTIKKEENANVDIWTEEQQKALESALKAYPSSLPANERWTKISKEVPEKTKKQCVDRYKYLSSMLKGK